MFGTWNSWSWTPAFRLPEYVLKTFVSIAQIIYCDFFIIKVPSADSVSVLDITINVFSNNWRIWWAIFLSIILSISFLRLLDESWIVILFYFFNGIHSMQGWTATTRYGVTRKRNTKSSRHAWNLFRKNLQLKDVC